MLPCPFCEGPPCLTAHYSFGRKADQIFYGVKRYRDGIHIRAYVWCHECGAHGPHAEDFVYCDDDVVDLKRTAAELWNLRDSRHRSMYDGGEAEGLSEHPRADHG